MAVLMLKEDFVLSVMSSLETEFLRQYETTSAASGERLASIMLAVMVWASRQSRLLLRGYRDPAFWIRMSYDDRLLDEETRKKLRSLSIQKLVELVWEVKEHCSLAPEATAYLREYFREGERHV